MKSEGTFYPIYFGAKYSFFFFLVFIFTFVHETTKLGLKLKVVRKSIISI